MEIKDYFNIKPDKNFVDLSSNQKVQLIDQMQEKKRGLIVTLDLSHSARRINNRVYTTVGQKEGIASLTSPFPKPIIMNHDPGSEPLGRFMDGYHNDLTSSAYPFFRTTNDLLEFKKAFDSNDPERIAKVMNDTGLIASTSWKGLSSMRTRAKINDVGAIEKFLDGRYLTFSAGSNTDRYICSICMCDYAKNDYCEHEWGKVYDGKVCFIITGSFNVREGSVVNSPADDEAQTLSLTLTDSIKTHIEDFSFMKMDRVNVFMSDSIYELEDNNENADKQETSEGETQESQTSSVEETAKDNSEAGVSDGANATTESEKEVVPEAATVEQGSQEQLSSTDQADTTHNIETVTVKDFFEGLTKINDSIESLKVELFSSKRINSDFEDLKREHLKLLDSYNKLQTKTSELLEVSEKTDHTLSQDTSLSFEDRLGNLIESFQRRYNSPKEPVKVVNPSIVADQDSTKGSLSKNDDFVNNFLKRYKQIKETKGEKEADKHYKDYKRYLPSNFKITDHLGD